MDSNFNKIALDLYGKIQTRFPNIQIGDEDANVLTKKKDVPKARFFEFEYEDNGDDIGTITMTLDADDGLVVEVSGDIIDKKHPGAIKFIRSFRPFAKDRLLNFKLQRLGKSNLDKRDYQFRSQVKDDIIMENKLYGTSRMSYQDLGEARLIIKHSANVNPELPAGRTMHIEGIWIENSLGERFKYPAKHLNGARALAEHIKHGGTPYDNIGVHIIGLSEELSSLRKFKGYVSRHEALSEAMGEITTKVFERIEEIKKEIHNLQKSSYYEEFAESFTAAEAREIPEDLMDDWVDRLTIRTFNEELKSVFPYIFKLVDESEIPVKELNPDDLLDEGGVTLPNADGSMPPGAFTVADQIKMNQQFANQKQGEDLGDGFSKTNIEYLRYTLPAVMDNQSGLVIFLNKNPQTGTAIVRTPAAYMVKQSNGDITPAFDVGPATKAALTKAGLLKEEDQFENFINSIVDEEDNGMGALDARSDVKKNAIDQLNKIFSSELKGGVDNVNFEKVKELIPDQTFAKELDNLNDADLDARLAIKAILQNLALTNNSIDNLLSADLINFGDNDDTVGGEPAAPEQPEEPAAPEQPEEPAAPEQPAATEPAVRETDDDPPFDPDPPRKNPSALAGKHGQGHSTARHLARQGLHKAIAKAVKAGAKPDTELDFGHKKMTLMGAMQECGIDPASMGFNTANPKEELLKSVAGFWNAQKRNFTIGGTKAKKKAKDAAEELIRSGMNREQVVGALREVMAGIEKLDPSSDLNQGHDIVRLAGLNSHHGMEEGTAEDDFAELISNFKSEHGDVDINQLFQQLQQQTGGQQSPAQTTTQQTSNQTGTIDGKPASYDDAMKKFRNIAGGMGFDGSSPEAMQKSIQGKLSGMMKGMNMPGFQENVDMELSAMLKGAGIKK